MSIILLMCLLLGFVTSVYDMSLYTLLFTICLAFICLYSFVAHTIAIVDEAIINEYLSNAGCIKCENATFLIPTKAEISLDTVELYIDNLGLIDGLYIVREKPLLFFLKPEISIFRYI